MNKEQDELLVAWLVKRGYKVYTPPEPGRLVMTQHYIGNHTNVEDVRLEHIGMWVAPIVNERTAYISLHKKQRGKRRPLRSLLWGLVLGL